MSPRRLDHLSLTRHLTCPHLVMCPPHLHPPIPRPPPPCLQIDAIAVELAEAHDALATQTDRCAQLTAECAEQRQSGAEQRRRADEALVELASARDEAAKTSERLACDLKFEREKCAMVESAAATQVRTVTIFLLGIFFVMKRSYENQWSRPNIISS